jgi:uncharacterized protein YutD
MAAEEKKMNEYIISDQDCFDIIENIQKSKDTIKWWARYSPSLGGFLIVQSKLDILDFTLLSGAEYINQTK